MFYCVRWAVMNALGNGILAALMVPALIAMFVNGLEPHDAYAQTAPSSPLVSPVVVTEAQRATVVEHLEAIGSLRANESTVISPELSGRIENIAFREGQRVMAGENLLSLDSALYQAEVAKARASLELSQANYERAKELLARNAGSIRARDEALARQRVDEARLALAETRLAKLTLTAPFNGSIGLRTVSVGDYVVPGQDIVTLVDTNPIKVDFRLPEIYLSALDEGQKIDVSVDAFPGETFTGQIYAIDPVIDINGRAVQLRARISNPRNRLRPGLFVRINVNVNRREDTVLIDESALITRENGTFVYCIEDGHARLTQVRLGVRRSGEVEVISGLASDAIVVTAGHQRLNNGSLVEIVERS